MEKSKNPIIILILLSLAQLMIVLDFSIVNVALPSIQSQFLLSPTELQWVVSAYALTFGGFLLLGGRASDIFNRKLVFISGLVIFSSASLVGGLATSAVIIFISRAAQGLGAALLSPSALSFVTTIFEEGPERNWALGIFSSMAAIGFTVGVTLGGVLTSTFSWHWVFFVNVPIGILVIVIGFLVLPKTSKDNHPPSLDLKGAVLATASILILVYAISQISIPGESFLDVMILFLLSLILATIFIYVERKVCIPLVPLDIFRRRTIVVADIAMFFTFAANASLVFITTLYLQEVRGYSALETGFIFIPAGLGGITGSVIAPRLIKKIGFRNMLPIGLSMLGLGIVGFISLSINSSIILFMIYYYIGALGLVSAIVSLNIAATTGVEKERQGLAAGLLTTSQQIGAAIGISIASVVLATIVPSANRISVYMFRGYHATLVYSEVLIIISLILTIYVILQPHSKKK